MGSFTIYKNGKPLIIDLGVGTYTRETFSDKRYEIWTMQSQFHNVPTFIKNDTEVKISNLGKDSARDYHDDNVIMQRDGAEFQARDVEFKAMEAEGSESGKESFLSMDISGAYPDPGIRKYHRSVGLKKGKGILVLDEYEGEPGALLTLMTYEKPVEDSSGDGNIHIRIGSLGEAKIEGARLEEVQTFPIDDERLKLSWEHEVYRVLMRMDEGHKVRMEIT